MVNEEVFRKAVAFGLGVNGTINKQSVFDRKNYFYPDLPKGYQITQLSKPIVEHAKLIFSSTTAARKSFTSRGHTLKRTPANQSMIFTINQASTLIAPARHCSKSFPNQS